MPVVISAFAGKFNPVSRRPRPDLMAIGGFQDGREKARQAYA
jgi:hypothetical protein